MSKKYSELSTDAKMLYGLLLDRMSLSMKNGWRDEKYRVYIIYEIKEIMKNFEISKSTAVKMLQDLEKCGLVEKKKRGLGRPDLIYVKNFIEKDVDSSNSAEDSDNSFAGIKTELQEDLEIKLQEGSKTKLQEVSQIDPLINNTNMNNINDIESNHIKSLKKKSRLEELKEYEELIKVNIKYERLKKEYPQDLEMIDGLLDLILETIASRRESIYIARDIFPKELVQAKFLKLKYEHMRNIIKNLKKYSNRAGDKKKYWLAVLFNAPSVFDNNITEGCCDEKKMQKKENKKNKISTQIEQYDYDFDELERLLVINN